MFNVINIEPLYFSDFNMTELQLLYNNCDMSNNDYLLNAYNVDFDSYGCRDKFYLAYLKSWPLDTATCRHNKKVAKFYIDLWKQKKRTNVMKEIIKQMKATKWKRN